MIALRHTCIVGAALAVLSTVCHAGVPERAMQVARAHGSDSFGLIEQLVFTFNVKKTRPRGTSNMGVVASRRPRRVSGYGRR